MNHTINSLVQELETKAVSVWPTKKTNRQCNKFQN